MKQQNTGQQCKICESNNSGILLNSRKSKPVRKKQLTINYLTDPEIGILLSSVSGSKGFKSRNRAIITLLLKTGLRASELVGLNVTDVKNGASIREEIALRPEIAKGGRPRLVPLNNQARQAIKQILSFNEKMGHPTKDEDPLIWSRNHNRLTRVQLWQILSDIQKKIGLNVRLSPHTLRHTFATKVYKQTGNLRVTQTLLGHASISTTEIYTHVNREDLRQAVSGV